jgi:hypothetical protein
MDKRWLLVALYLTYLLHEAWTLLPNSFVLYKPFPFSEQEISMQSYIFGACQYGIWIICMVIIWELFEGYQDIMVWFVGFQVLEFFEYFLTYNEPLFFIPNPIIKVGINITTIKIVTMFLLVLKKLLK